jgi:iron complex outermembrane recepter protein
MGWYRGLAAGSFVLAGTGLPLPAVAQEAVELPPVVVTTPSPVARPAPARRPAAPRPSPSATEAEVEPFDATLDLDVPFGTIIVSDDAFVPVTVATEREFLANPGATITDTLQYKPGITGSTFAPGASRPIIRGLDSYRIRIQENGIGTHDVSAISEDHAIPIDPLNASRVEVVRGPATLRYGSQAIGGVVSVENQRIPTFMPERGFTATVKGGGATVNDGLDGAFSATGGANGIVVHADGFWRDQDDYRTPRGRELNSFVESKGGAVGLSHVWRDGFVGMSLSCFESFYGIPGREAEEGHLPRIDLWQNKVLSKGEWRLNQSGLEAIRFWFGASNYKHDELAIHGHGHAHGHDDDEFEVGSRFTNQEQELRVEAQHLPVATSLGLLRGAVGVHWNNRNVTGTSFEGDSLLEPAHARSFAGFWFEELEMTERLRFQGSVRVEGDWLDGTGYASVADIDDPVFFRGEQSFVPVSGGIGMLYELWPDVVMRLNGQSVQRAPDVAELFSKGIHEATGTFEIGNPFLDKERAHTVEFGLKRAVGRLRFDANTYYTRFDGFIYRDLTGEECGEELDSCGVEDEFGLVLFQQRNANFYGAELAAQYDVAPLWRGIWGIDGQYDFVRARFTNGENVPRIPPHRLGGGIFYRDQNWFARTALLHAFEQNQVAPGELTTPGYTLLSAEISYDFERGRDGWFWFPGMTVGVKGENLLDQRVLNAASFQRRDGVLEPGANVRVFGSIKLN